MPTVRDLARDLTLYLPAAPEPLVRRALLDAARTFFSQAQVWRLELPLTPHESDPTKWVIDRAEEEEAEAFDAPVVKYRNRVLTKQTRERMLRHAYPDRGRPWDYVVLDVDEFKLLPVPDAPSSDDVEAVVLQRPTRDATEIPDLYYQRFSDTIRHGVMMNLLQVPARHWTSPEQAEYYRQLFERGIADARAVAADNNQVGVARTVKYGGL